MKEAIPDIIIRTLFLIFISIPIVGVVVIPTPIEIEKKEETENEKYNNKKIIAALIIYQTAHASECDKCDQQNFPACEKSKGFMKAILNFN
jgi:hypothetical protein